MIPRHYKDAVYAVMKSAVYLLFLLTCHPADAQYRIISYNVENFFDTQHDTLKNDYDFLPAGKYRWTYRRFSDKASRIARVICQAGQWDIPLLVGLCEVENKACLDRLLRAMPNHPYRYIHYESPDERGIDVALLYDSLRFRMLNSRACAVSLENDCTRDILYAAGQLPEGDTLHLMVCHLPSMRGGQQASEWKRQRAKQTIQHITDSILSRQPNAQIVVMGDMNSQPRNDLKGLNNRMIDLTAADPTVGGTHKWQGIWTCLDQFYLSPSMDQRASVRIYTADFLLEDDQKHLGKRPVRTWQGYRYNSQGYSDHLPVILDFR